MLLIRGEYYSLGYNSPHDFDCPLDFLNLNVHFYVDSTKALILKFVYLTFDNRHTDINL